MQTDHLRVNVVIHVSATALQEIVAQCKRVGLRDANGMCRVDTADRLGELVSRFLHENDFEAYVKDPGNYP
jgi:hypothetical protein